MPRSLPSMAIDARPRGPAGPLACEHVLGRTILERHLELASRLAGGRCVIHAHDEDRARIQELASRVQGIESTFDADEPARDACVLRADRLYDPARALAARNRRLDLETSVIWRLDEPHALAAASQELLRRQTYQPIGRFWALRPAVGLAERLKPTRIRPNHVTIAAAVLVFASSALVVGSASSAGAGLVATNLVIAVALAAALVLDTADGRLARLQGTASAFGARLDVVLDEAGDLALHAAIAWRAYVVDGGAAWIALGAAYIIGKSIYLRCDALWSKPTGARAEVGSTARATSRVGDITIRVRTLVRLAGHADVRWHIWIALAACGRLDVELATYACYYPLRTAARALGEVAAARGRGGVHVSL